MRWQAEGIVSLNVVDAIYIQKYFGSLKQYDLNACLIYALVRYYIILQVQGSNFVFPCCANAGGSKFKLLLGINSESLESLRTAFSTQLETLHCLRADDERCASIWSTSSNPSDKSRAHQLLDNFLKRRDEVNKIDNPYLRALIARYLG